MVSGLTGVFVGLFALLLYRKGDERFKALAAVSAVLILVSAAGFLFFLSAFS